MCAIKSVTIAFEALVGSTEPNKPSKIAGIVKIKNVSNNK